MEGSSKTKRGKSLTTQEDVAIYFTKDPIVGNSQSHAYFLEGIFENYCSLQNDQSRTQVSISSQWGVIMKCCNKFRGCLAQVENLHLSRMSQVDIVRFHFHLLRLFLLFRLI